jgi:hypothetical protein
MKKKSFSKISIFVSGKQNFEVRQMQTQNKFHAVKYKESFCSQPHFSSAAISNCYIY